MLIDSSRPIKNTSVIKRTIQKCLDLYDDTSIVIALDGEDFRKTLEDELEKEYLGLKFVKDVKRFWNDHSDDKIYIHELLDKNELYLPKYEAPPRNMELDARVERIKAQISEQEYQRMVYNVDLNSPLRYNEEKSLKSQTGGIFPEFKTVQGQLVSIFNIVATVGGAFAFGYKAIEYSLDTPDVTKQMIGGFLLAIVVAIADIYFLFKKLLRLDEQSSKPNTKTKKRN